MSRQTYGWPDANVDGPRVWEDPSFGALLADQPSLHALLQYLPQDAAVEAFKAQSDIDAIPTSYQRRGYGVMLYALVRALRPRRVMELGVFEGFSLLSMAAGLRDNGGGRIEGRDLFEAYPFRHAVRSSVTARVAALGLEPWASVASADAFEVRPDVEPVDILHVDVSNNGDTYRRIFERWAPHVTQAIVLEGGDPTRDRVQWMQKYGKPAIAPAIEELRGRYPEWRMNVLAPFPSLTIATPARAR